MAKRDAKFKLGEPMRRASHYPTYFNFLLENMYIGVLTEVVVIFPVYFNK